MQQLYKCPQSVAGHQIHCRLGGCVHVHPINTGICIKVSGISSLSVDELDTKHELTNPLAQIPSLLNTARIPPSQPIASQLAFNS